MKIDFLGLQAFVSIAERGSFLAAAQHLNLSATAVSHRIRKLEEELAVDLLLRLGRSVTLTSAGAELLPKARRSIGDLVVCLEEVRRDGCQRRMFLAFGCLPALAPRLLPSLLKKVKRECPDLYVRVYDRSASEIADMVESSDLEFGITTDFGLSPDLRAEAFAQEDFFLVCRKDHPLADKAEISWDDLSDQPLVRISEQTCNRRLIDNAIGLRRETLRWEYEVQRAATAMNIVQAGLAAALLPHARSAIDPSSNVSYVALRSPGISRTLSIVTRRDATLSPNALLFRNTILEAFKRAAPLK